MFVIMLLLSFLVTVSSLVLDGSGSVFICSYDVIVPLSVRFFIADVSTASKIHH